MELRHLHTFKTIVDEGGFSKAADVLGYAQSSITSHIKDLERELGYPLFDRLGKRIALTHAGKRFLPYALEIIDLYAKSKEVIQEGGELTGELTIGVSESLMIYWLPHLILQFTKDHPKIELTIKLIDYQNLAAQLKKGDIDAAVLVDTANWESNELTTHKIRNEKLTLIQSNQKPSSDIPETMLVTEYFCSWRPLIDQYLRSTKKTEMKKIEFPSIEAIKKCVECGLGQSFLPYFAIEHNLKEGTLQELKTTINKESIAIYTAYHKSKWLSRNLETFLTMVHEEGKTK